MEKINLKKNALLMVCILFGSMIFLPSTIQADDLHHLRAIRDFDEILIFTEGIRTDDGDVILDYLITDDFTGDWCDAEKTIEDTEDDVQCWAAAASNVLEWTRWGINVEPGIQDCDDIFQEFQDHWIDTGGLEDNGWHWWFDGTAPAGDIDVAGGGNYYPTLTWSDYFHHTWYDRRAWYHGCPGDDMDLMQALDTYLHNGWGVTLGFPSHAITAWGFSYNSSVSSDDFADYYTGIYVTDSDDDKNHDPDPGNPNEADEYPDSLRYYDIEYNDTTSRWSLPGYSGGWVIDSFFAFEPKPFAIPVADAGSDQTVNEGSLVTFDGTGSSDADGHTLTYAWDFGDGTTGSGTTPTHTYCDNAVYTVTLTVTDTMYDTDTDTTLITVHNIAPTATLGNDGPVNEGSPVTLTFSDQYDPGCDTLSYSFDWENDGVYDLVGQSNPTATHSFCDDGSYTIRGKIQDDDGGSTEYTTDITVYNVAPVAQAGNDQTINEGTIVYFSGSITDPGTCDDLTYIWDFGDASASISTTLTPTHTYGDNGIYSVTLTVSDDDGGSAVDTLIVTVTNLNPTIVSFGPFTINENTPLSITASATDQGSDDLSFHWSFPYGPSPTTTVYNNGATPDPALSPSGTYPFTATDTKTHTYGDDGTFTLTLTVTDDDGGSTTYTTTITVTNVNPTLTLTMTLPYPENPNYILPVHTLDFTATTADTGSDDLTITWDFGDGTTQTTTYYNNLVNPDPDPSPDINPITRIETPNHQYAAAGTYTVTVTVHDDDGGSATTTYTLTVLTLEEAKHDINEYILSLPDAIFKGNPTQKKITFTLMFTALDYMLEENNYWGMIQSLSNNIRPKCDGYIDGNKKDDWIDGSTTDGYNAQLHITSKIDDLIVYLTTYL